MTMNEQQSTNQAQPTARRVPFACHRCKTVLAYIVGGKLERGDVVVYLACTLECPKCGQERFWKPLAQK